MRRTIWIVVLSLVAFTRIAQTEETCGEDIWMVNYEVDEIFLRVSGSGKEGAEIRMHIRSLDTSLDDACWFNREFTTSVENGTFKSPEFNLCTNTGYNVKLSLACESVVKDSKEKTVWTAPEAPANVKAEEVTNSSFVLKWDSPPGSISAYRIELNEEFFVQNSNETFYRAEDLDSNTNYSVKVSAKGKDLWSKTSELIVVRTERSLHPPVLKFRYLTNTTVDLSWEDLGDDQLLYAVKWHSDGGDQHIYTTNQSNITVENLTPFTHYNFYVRVSHGNKIGSWSDVLRLLTKAGIPHPPQNVRKIKRGSRNISLAWDEPQPSRGDITSYSVTWKTLHAIKRSIQPSNLLSTNNTWIILEKLKPARIYLIQVSASTLAGMGDWSEPIEVKTLSEPPFPPTNIMATLRTENSISLKWDLPNRKTEYTGKIELFTVQWNSIGNQDLDSLNTTELKCTIENLSPFTTYYIRLMSWNEAGSGNWSDDIIEKTSAGIPFSPRNLREGSVTNLSIEMEWDEPYPNVGSILRYKLKWTNLNTKNVLDREILNTSYLIEELAPFTNYSIQVQAKTEAGYGASSDPVIIQTKDGVPSPPRNLRQVSTTNSSIEIAWDEPQPEVGRVLRYKLMWINMKTDASVEKETESTSYLIPGLNPYTNYSILVQAKTSAGYGAWSDPVVIQTEIGVPNFPENLREQYVSNTSIEIVWDSLDDSIGPIILYKVMWMDLNSSAEQETETGDTFYLIQKLKPYTIYSIQVQAKTMAGYGSWSRPLRLRTGVGVPYAPRQVREKNTTDRSIEVEWDQPIPNVGPIETYRVQWSDLKTSKWKDEKTKDAIFLIGDLNSFNNYSIRVQAETSAGVGSWSDPVIIQTGIGVPAKPQKLMEERVTNRTIEVRWEEPQPYRGAIESYTIQWSSSNDTTGELRYLITDLIPFTDYNISVRAKTEAGFGSWSDVLSVKTKIGTPSPPMNLRRNTVKNTSIEIEWDVPVPDVGPITLYRVCCTNIKLNVHQMHETTNSVYLIMDLNPYTNYSVEVQAETEAGPGNWSDPVLIRTSVGIPSEPEKVMKGHVTNLTIEVVWEEPQPDRGPIESYTILWASQEATTSELRYVITNLTPYTDYNIFVRAKTEAGFGSWSNALKVKTKIGIPSIPRNVSDENKNATYIRLMWLQPHPMNGPLHSYKVQWNAVGDDRKRTALTNDTSQGFYRLLPYTEYTFRVSASTVEGWGEASATFTTRTGIAAPPVAMITALKIENSSTLFVEWSAEAPFPGPTTFQLHVLKWPGQCEGSRHIHDILNGTKSRNEWTQPTRIWVPELSAYSRYSVSVSLRTEAGETTSGDSDPINTPAKAPGPPTNVRANCEEKSTEADVSWSLPVNPNAEITHYFVEYGTEYLGYREMSVKVNDVCQVQKITLRGLRPEKDYRIFVRAVGEGVSAEGERTSPKTSCRLPAGVPPIGNAQWIKIHSPDPFHLSVIWNDAVFSDAMGSLIEYSMIIGKSESVGEASRGKVADDVPSWANYSSGLSEFYQGTPSGWNPFLKNDEEEDPLNCKPLRGDAQHATLQCTLGLESNCSMSRSHCNGPLNADTFYWIKMRAFTRRGYSETDPMVARTAKYSNKSGLIGGLIGGFLVIFCCLSVGVFFIKRKGGFEHVRKIIESRLLQPAAVTPQPETVVELETYQHGRSIKIHYFCEHVRIMLSDSHLKFSEEFETLRLNSPKLLCTAAEMEENRHKNRWMNIFPYDHSRVKLLPLGDEPASDFINSNYIVGDSSLREYIASQGSLPHTVDDFWRMIWEQSSTMIVMLTQLIERGKVKCEKYWPDEKEPKFYGDIQVRMVSESMLSSYIIRVFHVNLGSQERMVKQMHFTHWPDFGCPERPEDLINFVRAVRDHLPRIRPGPIVVHCSAGVGRTGTFITVDRLTQRLKHSDSINIFETVMELRQHRINMVQTEDQYIYIHLCVQQLVQEILQPQNQECNEPIYSNVSMEKDTGL